MSVILAVYKADGDITNKIIRHVCGIRHGESTNYSHVEILCKPPVMDSAYNVECAFSVAATKRDGQRVRCKYIPFKKGHWDFLTLPHARSIFVPATQEIGKPYDVTGVILCPTFLSRIHKEKQFCSGLVAELMGWDRAGSYDPYMIATKMITLGAKVTRG